MTDHDKKISGVEAPVNPVQQQSAPSEGRRRLMKGALAAPAVMTLMSGRLMAATSLTCVERQELLGADLTSDNDYNYFIGADGKIYKKNKENGEPIPLSSEEAEGVLTKNLGVGSCLGSFA